MSISKFGIYFILITALGLSSCGENEPDPPGPMKGDLENIPYDPTTFEMYYPTYTLNALTTKVPEMDIPADNPMTEEGVDLGRHLFYDKLLSADQTMSCATCHLPSGSFTDNKAVSVGIDGIPGERSSMSLFNIGFINGGLFWDGRSANLEEQAILPVEDPIELHNSWDLVIERLQESAIYPEKFRKAFGIKDTKDINKELAAKAIAQFERSLYSFESKFDKFLKGEVLLTDEEAYGFDMYRDAENGIPDAECAHCHSLPLMGSDEFFNNGLQAANQLEDFRDKGLGGVIGEPSKNGFFRAVSLRNIEYSAPYMHDGSLATLDDVIDHYASGGKPSPTKDPLLTNIKNHQLDDFDKAALKAFLLTLSDKAFLELDRVQNPFQ